jgi:hypothetical protein
MVSALCLRVCLATKKNVAAVDMDVFGAFQLCAIGILAAPITVKLSRTYFNDPGRNAIFVWTILVLIGKGLPRCICSKLLTLKASCV